MKFMELFHQSWYPKDEMREIEAGSSVIGNEARIVARHWAFGIRPVNQPKRGNGNRKANHEVCSVAEKPVVEYRTIQEGQMVNEDQFAAADSSFNRLTTHGGGVG